MRIIFSCETSSIHSARWINQLTGTGWDVHVFQGSLPFSRICPEFRIGVFHVPFADSCPEGCSIESTMPSGLASRLRGVLRRAGKKNYFATMRQYHQRSLETYIEKSRPDVIHSLGLNIVWRNHCLQVLRSKQRLGARFSQPWLYSSWGTDFDFYARMSDEKQAEVNAVALNCDYYVSECDRDLQAARTSGFNGPFVGFFPAYGGMESDVRDFAATTIRPGLRNAIYIKGRDCKGERGDPVGRAMTALNALRLCGEEIKGYSCLVGQAVESVRDEVTIMRLTERLPIYLIPKLAYRSVLRVVGASRVLVALTVNDGLPSTLVEAMALGAFPIHSDLDSVREWIKDGENGLLVPPEDPEAVAQAIRRALTDDDLVDRAAEINARIVREQLSDEVVRPKVIRMYEKIVDDWKKNGKHRADMNLGIQPPFQGA